MRGYKVVRNVGGMIWARTQLVSASTNRGAVYYEQGRPVTPDAGNGPLCVFATLDAAAAFASRCDSNVQVWECDYAPSDREHVWFRGTYSATCPLADMPAGTRLADSVTLTRRLQQVVAYAVVDFWRTTAPAVRLLDVHAIFIDTPATRHVALTTPALPDDAEMLATCYLGASC